MRKETENPDEHKSLPYMEFILFSRLENLINKHLIPTHFSKAKEYLDHLSDK